MTIIHINFDMYACAYKVDCHCPLIEKIQKIVTNIC